MKCLSAGIEVVYIFGSAGLTRGQLTTRLLPDHQVKPANDVIIFAKGNLYFYFELCKTGGY